MGGKEIFIYPPYSKYSKKTMFKAKLRKIVNSQGIYIPKEVITNYKIGDLLSVEVLSVEVITTEPQTDYSDYYD